MSQNNMGRQRGSATPWVIGAMLLVAVAAWQFLRFRHDRMLREQRALAAQRAFENTEPSTGPILGWRPSAASPVAPTRPLADPNPGWGDQKQTLEETWGIELSSMRLSMAGTIIDVRFKVTDVDKARKLADGKTIAYLLDLESGSKLQMPSPPREGAFPPRNTPGRFALEAARKAACKRSGGSAWESNPPRGL